MCTSLHQPPDPHSDPPPPSGHFATSVAEQALFPGRIQLVLGDSSVTVPAYAKSESVAGNDPRVCNVVFVDGDHSEEGAYADLTNFHAMTSRSGSSRRSKLDHNSRLLYVGVDALEVAHGIHRELTKYLAIDLS